MPSDSFTRHSSRNWGLGEEEGFFLEEALKLGLELEVESPEDQNVKNFLKEARAEMKRNRDEEEREQEQQLD